MEIEPGIYDQLITRRLAKALEVRAREHEVLVQEADPADAHVALAKHLSGLLSRLLSALPAQDRLDRQVEICNRVIELLHAESSTLADDESIEAPARYLLAVANQRGLGSEVTFLPRPTIPLSQSALLVNSRDEPSVGAELVQELESADGVDLLCAFIRFYGVRIIRDPLRRFLERGGRFRVLTTTYMGATERKAIDELYALGADVKITYEVETTRLHAKAWLFERRTGFSTAYIGSSNLSRSALLDGLEWNVRLSHRDAPDILEKFRATFETYWNSELFESWHPTRDAARFAHAVGQQARVAEPTLAYFDVHPRPHQQRILDDLVAERTRHDRWRNLVVAATGTGKTVIAALDYRRLREQMANPSLLFVAHRREILNQSLHTFRNVLRDGAFGELYVEGHRPEEWRHVFASIQSLAALDPTTIAPGHFDIVIVDEFHHAAAATYRKLLDHLSPRVLLGLTATPERADGKSVTEWFDGRFASQLRLWDALEEGILCPFHYFGISDDVDLSRLEWKRGGYDTAALEQVYTGNDARVTKIIQALSTYGEPGSMRALGFCVSVAHAEYMARRFNEAGISSVAVSASSRAEERDGALRRLRDGDLRVIFAVDLFNEGVDVPEIDTVLLLRPTESATVFLQQLGRGLRRTEGKACLTVFDFIGQQHRRFRFDLRFRALTGSTRRGLEQEIEAGFPFLPAGCYMELDRVAQRLVLDSVRSALHLSAMDLARELKSIGDVGLDRFLSESGLSLEDVYRRGGWTRLRRDAGFEQSPAGPNEATLSRTLSNLLHVDDPERTRQWARWLDQPSPPSLASEPARTLRLASMLHFLLWPKSERPSTLTESLAGLWANPAVLREIVELLVLLEDRARNLTTPLDSISEAPLHLHSRYTREEALAAIGASTVEKPKVIREGVYWDQPAQSDLFFVTLEKSEKRFSPTTRYRDYAISPELFHWESQNKTAASSAVGRRYIESAGRDSHVLLFVRERDEGTMGAMRFLLLGPATYVTHEGERPMAITWRLKHPMPPEFFQIARVAAG